MMPALLTRMSMRPNCVDRGVDERLRARRRGDVVGVGDRDAARGDDLGRDGRRRSGVRADALHRAAEVVDDDPRAPLGEQERVGPADPASRARDDRDAPFEAERAHASTLLVRTDRSTILSGPMPRHRRERRAPTQREVEGAPRRHHRHLGAGLRAPGLPRDRHRGAVHGQRSRQGRVLPLHRFEGRAPRRHPRSGDGRGDARRRSRRARRAGRRRRSWRCSATSCST